MSFFKWYLYILAFRFALDPNDVLLPESDEEIHELVERSISAPVKRSACRDSSDGADTDDEIEK